MNEHAKLTTMKSHVTLFGALWTVLWGFAQRNDGFLIVNYEDCCEEPESEFENLHTKLNLPLLDDDKIRHAILTQGPKLSQALSPFDVVRDTTSRRKAWSNRLSASDIYQVRSVWETFGVPVFQEASDW